MDQNTDNDEYMQWLHDLTTLGYEENLMIEAVHKDVLDYYFFSNYSPEKTLRRYKDFLVRWNAIRKDEDRSFNKQHIIDEIEKSDEGSGNN